MTYSCSFTDSVLPRMIRAKPGTNGIPIAIETSIRRSIPELPSPTRMISASRMEGKANSASMMRIRTSSRRPPQKPASSPMGRPAASPMMIETTPTCIAVRAPKMTRA